MTRERPAVSSMLVEAGVLGLAVSYFSTVAAGPHLFWRSRGSSCSWRTSSPCCAICGGARRAAASDLPRALVALRRLALATPRPRPSSCAGPRRLEPGRHGYGALCAVGFLAQMIVAVQQRLPALAAWLWAFAGAEYQTMPGSLHERRARPARARFAGWVLRASPRDSRSSCRACARRERPCCSWQR